MRFKIILKMDTDEPIFIHCDDPGYEGPTGALLTMVEDDALVFRQLEHAQKYIQYCESIFRIEQDQ